MIPVLDQQRHPVLSRMIPITTIWIWPVLVMWWGVALVLVPAKSAAMFGSTNQVLVDGLGYATIAASLLALVFHSNIKMRLVFLCVAGYGFLGRFTTFITTDILATNGWRSRMIGGATYALASTGHVIITSVAVMLLSKKKVERVRP